MFDSFFYEELHFYEQWWILIDLALLVMVGIGAALASYRRLHFWPIALAGSLLVMASSVGMTIGFFLGWNLPHVTVEVFSREFIETVKILPEPRQTDNVANIMATISATFLPFIGWQVAKAAWFLRQSRSTYLVSR